MAKKAEHHFLSIGRSCQLVDHVCRRAFVHNFKVLEKPQVLHKAFYVDHSDAIKIFHSGKKFPSAPLSEKERRF